jgi:hypothetical protein
MRRSPYDGIRQRSAKSMNRGDKAMYRLKDLDLGSASEMIRCVGFFGVIISML